MKTLKDRFPGFYKLDAEELKRTWGRATIFLDANFILNLYRYPAETRDDIIKHLSKSKERIWVAHYACLEYQRNRISVVLDQRDRFDQVKEYLETIYSGAEEKFEQFQLRKRHERIKPDQFLKKLKAVVDGFALELDALRKDAPDNFSDDSLRLKVEELFEGKVGEPPASEKELNDIYKEGELRFSKLIPPGFKDAPKAKEADAEFSYGGLIYKRQFGDLLVWKQIIEICKKLKTEDAIFLTDDDKEDWWQTVRSRRVKKTGVRVELVEEIGREAGVRRFAVYNSEQFVRFAQEELKAQFKSNTVENVASLAETTLLRRSTKEVFLAQQLRKRKARDAFLFWIGAQGYEPRDTLSGMPGIQMLRSPQGAAVACAVQAPNGIIPSSFWLDSLSRIYRVTQRNAPSFVEGWLVLVFPNSALAERASRMVERRFRLKNSSGVMFFGFLNEAGSYEHISILRSEDQDTLKLGDDSGL